MSDYIAIAREIFLEFKQISFFFKQLTRYTNQVNSIHSADKRSDKPNQTMVRHYQNKCCQTIFSAVSLYIQPVNKSGLWTDETVDLKAIVKLRYFHAIHFDKNRLFDIIEACFDLMNQILNPSKQKWLKNLPHLLLLEQEVDWPPRKIPVEKADRLTFGPIVRGCVEKISGNDQTLARIEAFDRKLMELFIRLRTPKPAAYLDLDYSNGILTRNGVDADFAVSTLDQGQTLFEAVYRARGEAIATRDLVEIVYGKEVAASTMSSLKRHLNVQLSQLRVKVDRLNRLVDKDDP